MPNGLKRYQDEGDLHFITFSCYGRQPYLTASGAYPVLETTLEETRKRPDLEIHGYVFMPEHVHLLASEPSHTSLAAALKYLKWSSSRQLKAGRKRFWHERYYDFNVFTHDKRVEKLRYIHRNPVKRGLVDRPENWRWSSFNFYMNGAKGPVDLTDGVR